MSELGELLERALNAGAEAIEVREETIDVQGLVGPEHRELRSSLAEGLSGSEDRSSRAYLSQRRNVERWARGRVPRPVTIRRLLTVQQAQRALWRRIRERGAGVRFKVSWYAERTAEWLPPGGWVELSAELMGPVMAAAEREDFETGGQRLWRTFLVAYGVPNLTDWLRDVEVVDLALNA